VSRHKSVAVRAQARHAVAIDERRKDLAPTLWYNTDAPNLARGFDPTAFDAPYKQKWSPGVHSSVVGGGERRGMSDQALDWIVDGARAAGLVLDPQDSSRIFGLKADYTEYLDDSPNDGVFYRLENYLAAADREPGPATLNDVSISAPNAGGWKIRRTSRTRGHIVPELWTK
jgi:type VI secretion system (T6SS) phospholipase Tle1-like effector